MNNGIEQLCFTGVIGKMTANQEVKSAQMRQFHKIGVNVENPSLGRFETTWQNGQIGVHGL